MFKKEGKSKQAKQAENDIVRVLYRIWPERSEAMRLFWNKHLQHSEQMNKNFGIKLFLSQNWGACVYTKIWEGERGTESFQDCVNQGIDCMRINISLFRCDTRIGSLRMTSADNDNKLRWRQEIHIRLYKRERLGSKLSYVRNVFSYTKDCSESYLNRIHA